LAALAAAGMWSLLTPAPPQHEPFGVERRRIDRMAAKEFRRAVAAAEHPGTPPGNRAAHYQRVAGFATPEAVECLRRAYEEGKRTGRLYPAGEPRGPDLVALLWGIQRSESAALLLRMIDEGHHDLRLVEAYNAVAGAEALPQLRRLAAANPELAVRISARTALLRRRHGPTVREFLEELCSLDPAAHAQDVFNELHRVQETRLVEAIPAVREMAAEFQARGLPGLEHRALVVLMSLGDRQSVPAAIVLLGSPETYRSSQRATELEEAMQRCTGQRFAGDAERWRRWWKTAGKHAPPPPAGPEPDAPSAEVGAIERAFLEWYRGDGRAGPMTYVEGRPRNPDSTETIRYYTADELRLLGKPAIRFQRLLIRGNRAWLIFVHDSWMCGTGTPIELGKDAGVWKVLGQAKWDENPWIERQDHTGL
jgi:hypothetical protein